MIRQLGLYSSNETLDDMQTEDLRYEPVVIISFSDIQICYD